MRTCANCGKKIEGRATKKYCGDTCKTGAYRSRKQTARDTVRNAISRAELKDINYIGNHSPDAKERLIRVHSICGKRALELALEAVYVAVVDMLEINRP
jgi:hypothetical protein